MIAPGGHGQGGNGLRDWSQSEAPRPQTFYVKLFCGAATLSVYLLFENLIL